LANKVEPVIIDDFIPLIFQKSIYELLCGEDVQWKFSKYSTYSQPTDNLWSIDEPTKEHIQFKHYFVEDNVTKSIFLPYIAPLIAEYERYVGKVTGTTRIKANLLMPQGSPTLEPPHVDDSNPESYKDGVYLGGRKTLLYYVNGGDGDTVLYNEKFYGEPVGSLTRNQVITPQRGRAVIFDSNHLHSACSPTVKRYRLIINCIFG